MPTLLNHTSHEEYTIETYDDCWELSFTSNYNQFETQIFEISSNKLKSDWQSLKTEATIASPPAAYLEWVERLYILNNKPKIFKFFEQHPYMPSLLLEMYSNIKTFFPKSRIFLEKVTNPEDGRDEQLLTFVTTDLSVEEALETYDKFEDAWWLNNISRADGKICIMLQYE